MKPKFSEEDKSEEKLERSKKRLKKEAHPAEKAKAVIEEIEEIKKMESAYYEALEQQFLINKNRDRKRSASPARSRSRDRERDRRKRRKGRRRSRSREKHKSKKVEKPTYPKCWKELKDHNFDVSTLPTLFPSETNINTDKVHDFRKQLVFEAPSVPLQEFVAKSVNGESITYPAEHIRCTKNQPSISYCVSEKVPRTIFDRKSVIEYVPKQYKEILEHFIINNSKLEKFRSPTRTTSRKWYPKESSTLTLLENSLGLTFLQNYSDDEDPEKEEIREDEEIDSDGVIAEILEDIGSTEILLSKNNEDSEKNTDANTLPIKPSRKKSKRKDSTSKSKKKKKKHDTKKSKKDKRKKKPKKEPSPPDETTSAPSKSNKTIRSRSKSIAIEISELCSIISEKRKSKRKSKKNKVVEDNKDKKTKRAKTDTTSNTEVSFKKKKDKSDLEKPKKKHTKNKDIKKSKSERRESINTADEITIEEVDGRTSDELRRLLHEKQKILEEHTRNETEQYSTKAKVGTSPRSVIVVPKTLPVKEDTNESESPKKVKPEKNTEKKRKRKQRWGSPKPDETEKHVTVTLDENNTGNDNSNLLEDMAGRSRREETRKRSSNKSCIRPTEEAKKHAKHNVEDKIDLTIDDDDDQKNLKKDKEMIEAIGDNDDKKNVKKLQKDKEIIKTIDDNDQDNVKKLKKGKEIIDEANVILQHETIKDKNSDAIKEDIGIYTPNELVKSNTDEKITKVEDKTNTCENMDKNISKDISIDYCNIYDEILEDKATKDCDQENIDISNTDLKLGEITLSATAQLYSPDVGNNKTRVEKDTDISSANVSASKTDELEVSIDKEIGTPNTNDYYSEWESDAGGPESSTKSYRHNRSWESDDDDALNNICNTEIKSYKNRNRSRSPNWDGKSKHINPSLNIPLPNTDIFKRQPEERRPQRSRSPEKLLEMPFNINNTKRERNNWRNDKPSYRNFRDRSPERIEMKFRIQGENTYSLVAENDWEKSEILSIKTEELRLEQERLSLLEERRKLEIEKQRFQDLERQCQQVRTSDDRRRRVPEKDDRYHTHRDYNQFNLNNFLENSRSTDNSTKPRNRWDISNKTEEKPKVTSDRTLHPASRSGVSFNKSTSIKEDPKKLRTNAEKDGTTNKSRHVPSTIKRPDRSSQSPAKLENEYEKFIELLEPDQDKATVKSDKQKDSKSKKTVTSTKIKRKTVQPRKRQTKKRVSTSSSSSSSSTSSLSSSSDSDSSSTSSTSTSSSSSSNKLKRKKRKTQLTLNKIELPVAKPLKPLNVKPVEPLHASMKTKGIQVAKTEIVKNKPSERSEKNQNLLVPMISEAPLPVPSPKIIIHSSAIYVPHGLPDIPPQTQKSKLHDLSAASEKTRRDIVTHPDKSIVKKDIVKLEQAKSITPSCSDPHISSTNKRTNEKQILRESSRQESITEVDTRSPKHRKMDSSPRGRGLDSSPKQQRRSISPSLQIKRKQNLLKRVEGSENSPGDHKKESIQEVLQRLAGMDNLSLRKKSPISSPIHGFKLSVADSTISDEQLLQYRVEEQLEISKRSTRSLVTSSSPKRVSLDERITQELGISAAHQTGYPPEYSYIQENQHYYDQFHDQQYHEEHYRVSFRDRRRAINQNVLQQIPLQDNNIKPAQMPPLQQNEVTNTAQKIKQVGNILEIIPSPSIEKLEVPQLSAASAVKRVTPPAKPVTPTTVKQTAKVITPTTPKTSLSSEATALPHVSTPLEKSLPPLLFSPISSNESSPGSSTHLPLSPKDMNAQALTKQKMERRAEKDKQKLERGLRREEKGKRLLSIESSSNDEDNASSEKDTLDKTVEWLVPKIVFNSSHKPPDKGILVKCRRLSKSSDEGNLTVEHRKYVKFADGVRPGEGTSPSGGEELSSPPPAPRKLPKEKRYKKTKLPKPPKVPKRKKVKVKVVRRAEEEDEDDDLPPPPPPPGSPPSHLFPTRIKTIINNIHPAVAVTIASSILQAETSLAPLPIFRSGLNVMAQQRPSLPQTAALQQHHLGSFTSTSMSPAITGLPRVPISVPPPPLHSSHQQHHIGPSNNHRQSPFISHHHH